MCRKTKKTYKIFKISSFGFQLSALVSCTPSFISRHFSLLFALCSFLFLLVSCLLSPVSCVAQSGDAGQPGEFLRYGVGARALGMGRAFTAVADDASAIYWNPAGLVQLSRSEATFMHTNLFYDASYNYFAIAAPYLPSGVLKETAIGFGWVDLRTKDFEQTDALGQYIGNFDNSEQAFFLSFSKDLVHPVSILNYGFNLKVLRHSMNGLVGSNYKDTSVGFDLGMIWQPLSSPLWNWIPLRQLVPFRLGLSLQNLYQPRMKFEEKTEYLPITLRTGLAYSLFIDDYEFLLTTDLEKIFDTERRVGLYNGIELSRRWNRFSPSIRLGINNRTEGFTAGFGLSLDKSMIGFGRARIDYAFGRHSALDNDHRFFITFGLGEDVLLKKAKKEHIQRRKHLRLLARRSYLSQADSSALELAFRYDLPNRDRYLRFAGGHNYADFLFEEAILRLKAEETDAAISKIDEAKEVYDVCRDEIEKNIRLCNSWLNYAECHMILAQYGDESTAEIDWRNALEMLGGRKDDFEKGQFSPAESARYWFNTAICHENLNDWSQAYNSMNNYVRFKDDLAGRQWIATLKMGEYLLRNRDFEKALLRLVDVVRNYQTAIPYDYYPRYPRRFDKRLADDAQYVIGQCREEMGQSDRARTEYAKLIILYPLSDHISKAKARLE